MKSVLWTQRNTSGTHGLVLVLALWLETTILQRCSLVGLICSQHQWLLRYSICPGTGDSPNIVNKIILFTRILAHCFIQLSCTCGGCFGLSGVARWFRGPAHRWLNDEWGDGIDCTAPGEGERSKWQCGVWGWLLAHLGEDGYKGGLSGPAPAQCSNPTARRKMAALWGAACTCHGWPWPWGTTPHSAPWAGPALGFMAGESGSAGRDRCCFLRFHVVQQARWNSFSCGASEGCCSLLMLLSTAWAAGSGKMSQAGILEIFNGQVRKKTFSWECLSPSSFKARGSQVHLTRASQRRKYLC